VSLRAPANEHNVRYLETKRDKLGHHFPDDIELPAR
jgi:GTP cyclohydrolase II